MDDGEYAVEGTLPAVMTVLKEAAEPRFAPLAGAMRAAAAKIETLDEKSIGADLSRIGFRGSPTKVVKIFPPPTRTGGRKTVWNGNAAELADTVKEAING
jgi:electron transfer flavoprotein beta subunit